MLFSRGGRLGKPWVSQAFAISPYSEPGSCGRKASIFSEHLTESLPRLNIEKPANGIYFEHYSLVVLSYEHLQ